MTPPPHAYFAAGDTSVGFTPRTRFGIFQFSQSPAKVNGRPSFMAIANGGFGLTVLRHS
jgi:hypothetical protein